jgi:ubiquinol-cytochrome c reductase cytochrome c1 subunit
MMRVLTFCLGLMASSAAAAAGPSAVLPFSADVTNTPSLQRGAANFMNYCSGCHSLQFLRYNRVARDLGIPEELVEKHLMYTTDSVLEHINSAMPADASAGWFGQAPPDLSLTARSKSPAWIYSFLNTYYIDPERPNGVDNVQLPGAAMPHVLAGLQGYRRLVEEENGSHSSRPQFETVVPGSLTEAEYRQFTADITNFLAYAAEPGKAARISLGWKVLFFLLIFWGLAYALKREYWKDVH